MTNCVNSLKLYGLLWPSSPFYCSVSNSSVIWLSVYFYLLLSLMSPYLFCLAYRLIPIAWFRPLLHTKQIFLRNLIGYGTECEQPPNRQTKLLHCMVHTASLWWIDPLTKGLFSSTSRTTTAAKLGASCECIVPTDIWSLMTECDSATLPLPVSRLCVCRAGTDGLMRKER